VIYQQSSINYWTYKPMNFTFWYAGEPNNRVGSEDCVNIWANHNYLWNDMPCNRIFCFICENRNAPK